MSWTLLVAPAAALVGAFGTQLLTRRFTTAQEERSERRLRSRDLWERRLVLYSELLAALRAPTGHISTINLLPDETRRRDHLTDMRAMADDIDPLITQALLIGTPEVCALAEKLRLALWRLDGCIEERIPPISEDARISDDGPIDYIAQTVARITHEYRTGLEDLERVARYELTGESSRAMEQVVRDSQLAKVELSA